MPACSACPDFAVDGFFFFRYFSMSFDFLIIAATRYAYAPQVFAASSIRHFSPPFAAMPIFMMRHLLSSMPPRILFSLSTLRRYSDMMIFFASHHTPPLSPCRRRFLRRQLIFAPPLSVFAAMMPDLPLCYFARAAAYAPLIFYYAAARRRAAASRLRRADAPPRTLRHAPLFSSCHYS